MSLISDKEKSRAIGGVSLFALLSVVTCNQDASAQVLPLCPSPTGGSCGLFVSPPPPQVPEGWLFRPEATTAIMNDATSSNLSIYMDGRGLLQPTQTLTVDGTDM